MKLVLANNQTERFVNFYKELEAQSDNTFEYASYDNLLFSFYIGSDQITVKHMATSRSLTDYDGVYLNGYLDTYELAVTMATCCTAIGIPFVNQELADAPSLSKLTAHAKMAARNVPTPATIAGAKHALLQAREEVDSIGYPLILKRADADRGIDNFKVASWDEIKQHVAAHDDRSIWIAQEFVENDGFYLVSFYDQKAEFSIFRSLEARPDGNEQKAHMYKPRGGTNATLLEPTELPGVVLAAAERAMQVMNRQIGSVDILHNPETGEAYVLEVNYNPQLVTIETFKETRVKAFVSGIQRIQ